MSNVDRARLLIRVAEDMNDPHAEHDRRELLTFAEELLKGENNREETTNIGQAVETHSGQLFPLEIFKVYKHVRYTATLLSNWSVIMDGVMYSTPSGASQELVKRTSDIEGNVNGWRFWKFVDPEDGQVKLIDELRQV